MIVSRSGYQTEAFRPGAHSAGLCRPANARGTATAAAILKHAIAERIATADEPGAHARLAFNSAERLVSASVRTVACGLGVKTPAEAYALAD